MSSITELADWSTCIAWLISASSPLAAKNAVRASTTGSVAATSAPKTTSRMPSASGTAVHSARFMSLKIVSVNHLLALAWPNCSMVTPGYAARARATAVSTGCTRWSAVSELPFIANWISTSCRPGETTGARRSWMRPVARTSATTARTAARNPGLAAVAVTLCTSTSSCAGSATPALVSSHWARPDSPVPYWACVIVTWPTAPPISMATMTRSSQPTMAVTRCRALQPPSEAAIFDRYAIGSPRLPAAPAVTAHARAAEGPAAVPL